MMSFGAYDIAKELKESSHQIDICGSIGHQVKNVHLCYIMGANKSAPTSGEILTVGVLVASYLAMLRSLRPFFDKISLSP